jgi:hypothetical protein
VLVVLLILQLVAASRDRQVFLKARYAGAAGFIKARVRSVAEGVVLVVLLILQLAAVTHQFRDNFVSPVNTGEF